MFHLFICLSAHRCISDFDKIKYAFFFFLLLLFWICLIGTKYLTLKIREWNAYLACSLWKFQSILRWPRGRVAWLRGSHSQQPFITATQELKGQKGKGRPPSLPYIVCRLSPGADAALTLPVLVLEDEPITNAASKPTWGFGGHLHKPQLLFFPFCKKNGLSLCHWLMTKKLRVYWIREFC